MSMFKELENQEKQKALHTPNQQITDFIEVYEMMFTETDPKRRHRAAKATDKYWEALSDEDRVKAAHIMTQQGKLPKHVLDWMNRMLEQFPGSTISSVNVTNEE